MHKIAEDLKSYFAQLRFFPNRNAPSQKVETLLTVNSAHAHRVYARRQLLFDNQAALKALKTLGINAVKTGAETGDFTNEIISPSAHRFAPVDAAVPKLVAFRFHAEHDGKPPVAGIDCVLDSLQTVKLGDDPKTAWLEIVPEVLVLKPEHPEKALFQSMLLKHCHEQRLMFWDAKVAYRPPARAGARGEADYDKTNHIFPERSNIGLIPVIKNSEVLRTPAGEIILAPGVIDSGSVVGAGHFDRKIQNLERQDLKIAHGVSDNMGYPHTEIGERNKDAPTLAAYVSEKLGAGIDITYRELITNYLAAIRQLEIEAGKGRIT